MKLVDYEVEEFINAPPYCTKAVLVYGKELPRVLEFAKRIAKNVVKTLNDPFNLSEMDASEIANDPARLSDEMHALSMTGERRLVWVHNATDKIGEVVINALQGDTGDTLLVIESNDLKASSKLRRLFSNKRKDMIALACYADTTSERASTIQKLLASKSVKIDPDAERFLIAPHQGSDTIVSKIEIEKFMLLLKEGENVDLDLVISAIGNSAEFDTNQFMSAVADGRLDLVVTLIDRAFQQGITSVQILRMGIIYFQQLHLARTRMNNHVTPSQAIKSLRSSIFFLIADTATQQLKRWNIYSLILALKRLSVAEILCKTTKYPDKVECRQAMIDITRLATMLASDCKNLAAKI
ncbi:DNA polymerase III, delta subunit [Candidatus Endolissoclinum faulkneri L2]|uniref:DNA-directed DNA polymerase n=1 Tax=Candidatus Endolissoclinum faulkneri L2 TaxID=1193729 RepID=K7Z3T9_9PROT|nr:DNA polymerase III subunit delta [Candidatus Endolissoclinum faulkneri]AFX98668.1 DNA polymerase III, delta subunit [Candidatus Endolissoclinum faulkneri L2]